MGQVKAALRRTARSRPVLLAAAFLCALLVVMGTTFAWFVFSDTKTSAMGAMQYQLDAILIQDTPAAPAVRGSVIPNEANVQNTGDIPAFVRAMVFPTLVAADGVTLLQMQLGEQVELGALGASWADGEDGYYYYTGLLGPGETTGDPLFEEVALAANIAANQTGAKLNLALIVESVNAADDSYRGAWWGGAIPASGSLQTVDNELQDILNGG
ncbi:MAG: hypothetical protein LBB75_10095 [Oscillospiraceae bacterium]|jgi:hypothetical protein|nr:hypothetical protein [Oscillospiraceae bacterium]